MNDLHREAVTNGVPHPFSPADIAAHGWTPQEIADALHGDVDKKGVLAPKEGHSNEDRSLRVLVGDQYPDGYWVCSAYSVEGEDWQPLLDYVLSLCPFLPVRGKPAAPLTEEQRAERARRRAEQAKKDAEDTARKRAVWLKRWAEATPLPRSVGRSVVATYLASRNVELPPNVFRQTLFEHKQAAAYGIMAEIVDSKTGDPFAHITYLDINGLKTTWREGADRITPGLTSDNGVGVIKLIAGADKAGRALCIGEGNETALSFAHLPRAKGATIWAGINAGNMAKIEPLDDFESILIAVDIEPSGAGAEAARKLAERWFKAGTRAPGLPDSTRGQGQVGLE